MSSSNGHKKKASKADLLKKSSAGPEEVEVPGVGTVTIRPLTRAEALSMQDIEMRADVMEQKLLALAMVEPSLTEDEVAEWQANSPAGLMHDVMLRIIEISGMQQIAAKAAYADFRGRSRA
jgi:hypothetical protein